ncbi:MAG: S1C family serine protease [Brevefilum sp.]|jgi:S1-C subfamily serine protease
MKQRKFKLLLVIGALVFSMLACAPISGILESASNQPDESEISEQGGSVETKEPDTDLQVAPEVAAPSFVIPDQVLLQDALVDIYQSVSPGVVSIQIYSQFGAGQGSGFVIDKEGHIVTNYHVIDSAEEVEVHFQSGLKVFGEVLGVDLDSDLAVVNVDVDPDELFPIPLGDSDQVRVGQSVVAIGNPYGLSGTMTTGIVSARGRTLESIRQTEVGTFYSAGDLIQTDANINPGNSGGPLLNLNGEVIGINRAIRTSGMTLSGDAINTGIGFAISSNILKQVLPSLVRGETYPYPYLGLSALSSLSLSQAEYLGLTRATGAYVVEIVNNGPAHRAGMLAGSRPTQVQGLLSGGDLIIGVDGREIKDFSEMLSYMMLNKHPGDEIEITVLRGEEEVDLTVMLGERPGSGQ